MSFEEEESIDNSNVVLELKDKMILEGNSFSNNSSNIISPGRKPGADRKKNRSRNDDKHKVKSK